MPEPIYKIVPVRLWEQAKARGVFEGAAVDLTDGYIHFSTESQVRETAAKHFAGQDDLLLLAIDSETLGARLRYEPSRGGALFPHLYGPLPLAAVLWEKPLRLTSDGSHDFESVLA